MSANPIAIKNVKPGEYVRLKPSETAPVWIRGAYDRSSEAYTLESWGDIGHSIQRKGSVVVYVDFEF